MSLFEMNGGLRRINGGIGFSIASPQNEISINSSEDRPHLENCKNLDISRDKVEYIKTVIANVCDNYPLRSCVIKLEKSLPSHHGFGSFTSLGMAVAEGLLSFNNIKYVEGDVIKLAKRGGTSGVGINTYFDGSLVVDLGHNIRKKPKSAFAPSSFASDRNPALKLISTRFPEWPILLVMPKTKVLSEYEEHKFFKANLPISEEKAAECIRIAFFGILPSIMTEDYGGFCRSLRLLRRTKWKANEIGLYGQTVDEIIQRSEVLGAKAASMSSLGPLVYCFGDLKKLVLVEKNLLKEFDLKFTVKTTPRNQGRELIVE